jgi:hypothetical protein
MSKEIVAWSPFLQQPAHSNVLPPLQSFQIRENYLKKVHPEKAIQVISIKEDKVQFCTLFGLYHFC